MATALDTAEFFLALGARAGTLDLTNLKLQKLVYYAQGFHLGIFDVPLFREDIHAGTWGPVVPGLYRHYARLGQAPLGAPGYDASGRFTREQRGLLTRVFGVFSPFSGEQLRAMTRNEPPWLQHERTASVIPQTALREYFEARAQG
ncbi:MAG TPA: type II toxin-antitoxin system antitoxin SocA domain-containing protein [Nevskiaceae bacterium]